MKKILLILTLSLLPYTLYTVSSEEIDITEGDLPSKYSLISDVAIKTVHSSSFYDMPSMQGTLPAPLRKRFQTLALNKKPLGSILYFEYKEGENLNPVLSFLKGLLWGSHMSSSKAYPEEVYVYNNIIIIFNFPYESVESDMILKIFEKKTGYNFRNEYVNLDNYEPEKYSIPEGGTLLLNIPQPFKAIFKGPEPDRPASLDLAIPNSKEFSINIAIYPSPNTEIFYDGENLRNLIRKYGTRYLENSVETKLKIQKLTGVNRTGYYYILTDKSVANQNVPEGKFRYLIQGGIRTGEILVVFVILSKDKKDSKEILSLLNMLKLARHIPDRK
ncbi:MAG: hypothetical protein ABUK01_13730 [Leptospirales bacterium]